MFSQYLQSRVVLTYCHSPLYSRPMATNETRTKTDEATDALAAIRDAEQELANWRQHIEGTIGIPDPEGSVYQALRSGHIVEALVGDALRHTGALRRMRLAEASS